MINGIKLGDQNLSPNQRRLRLKELSGQILTESEKKKLKPRKSLLNESVVSMVELPKNSDRMSPTQSLKNTFGSKKSWDELEDDDEIDLEEILREMGYYEDEDEESVLEINFNSKGYKEGRKLVDKLRRDLFKKLNDDELEDFVGVLKTSFDF